MYPSFVVVLVALQQSMNETAFNVSELPQIADSHGSQIVRLSEIPPALDPVAADVEMVLDAGPKEDTRQMSAGRLRTQPSPEGIGC